MDVMTPEEVAEILKVKPETIRRWLRRGELSGSNTPAGWRLTPADLETWLAKYRKPEQRSASTPLAAQATAAEGDAPAVDWD